jgi:hypothetical protein
VAWISFEEYLGLPKTEKSLPGRWKEFWMAKGKYLIGKLRG